jgi:hypothetical protein
MNQSIHFIYLDRIYRLKLFKCFKKTFIFIIKHDFYYYHDRQHSGRIKL